MRSHVAILLRLRWRLLLGSFAGRTGRRAAAIVGLLVIAAWAVSFGATAYRMLQPSGVWDPTTFAAARPAILRIVFLLTFLLQLMTGVAFLSVSDFFDTTRLLHLPVRARSIFSAMLISSVLSPGTLVFGAPAIGAMVALPGGLPTQGVRLLVVIALVVFGQACALFAGYVLLFALSRRRLRDLATVLGGVIGLGSYALIRLIGPKTMVQEWAASGPVWDALDFAPTSWFADLVAFDDPLRFGQPRFLIPAALALVASLVLGGWAFARFFERAGETADSDRKSRAAPRRLRLLPRAVGAVARQTLAIIWREPQLRALLFQQMIFLLIPLLSVPSGRGAAATVWSVPIFIVVSHGWMALSLLGIDGPGLKLLLQSPASRSQILLGRVFAVGRLFALIDVVAAAVLIAVMAAVSGLVDPWTRFLQITTACLVADGLMVGAGAFISVLAPFPLVRRSRALRMKQEGCAMNAGRAFLRLPVMFVAALAGLLVLLPEIAGFDPVWYFVTVPAGLLVVVQVAMIAIARGARRLSEREELIVAALTDAGD